MTSSVQASSATLWHHSKVKPLEVLVVGGGIAGIEALMALADLGESRLRLRIVAANPSFVLRPQILGAPWGGDPLHIDLARLCRAFGADFTAGTVDAVVADEHRIGLADGTTLPYDRLLLAPGARPALPYAAAHVLGFGPLPHELTSERAGSVAIVVPPGTSWTLPAYELALLTAARGRRDVRVVTAETAPLELFGPAAQPAIRTFLGRCGVVVEAGRAPEIGADVGDLADTVIALPLLEGPAIAGVAQDRHGFVQVDAAMAVLETEHVHAAGDATDGPVKQGGLAGQQADAAAAGIVRSCGGEPTDGRLRAGPARQADRRPTMRSSSCAERWTATMRGRPPSIGCGSPPASSAHGGWPAGCPTAATSSTRTRSTTSRGRGTRWRRDRGVSVGSAASTGPGAGSADRVPSVSGISTSMARSCVVGVGGRRSRRRARPARARGSGRRPCGAPTTAAAPGAAPSPAPPASACSRNCAPRPVSSRPRRTGRNGVGVDVGAGGGREQLGDRVGLLAGQPALLDGERRAVAGGVDVGQAADAAVLVDRDEAAVVAGHATDGDALDGRQRDDALGCRAARRRAAARGGRRPRGGRRSSPREGDPGAGRAARRRPGWPRVRRARAASSSGETSCRRASSIPIAWTSRAVISASS